MAQPIGTPGVTVEKQSVQPVLGVQAEVKTPHVGVPQTLAVPAPPALNQEVKTQQPVSTVHVPEKQQPAAPVQDVPITVDKQVDYSGTESFSGNVGTIASQFEELNRARMEVVQPEPKQGATQPVAPPPLQPVHTKQ